MLFLTFDFDDGTSFVAAYGIADTTNINASIGNPCIDNSKSISDLLDVRIHRFRQFTPFHLQTRFSAGNATYFGRRSLRYRLPFGLDFDRRGNPSWNDRYSGGRIRFGSFITDGDANI